GVSAARVLADMQTPGGVSHVAFIPLRPLATPPPLRSPHPRCTAGRVQPRRRHRPDPPALPRDPCHPHPSSLVLNYLRAVPATPHPRRTPPCSSESSASPTSPPIPPRAGSPASSSASARSSSRPSSPSRW